MKWGEHRWTEALPEPMRRRFALLLFLGFAPVITGLGVMIVLVSVPLGLGIMALGLIIHVTASLMADRFIEKLRYQSMPQPHRGDFLCSFAKWELSQHVRTRLPIDPWVIKELNLLLPTLSGRPLPSEVKLFRALFEYGPTFADPLQRTLLLALADRLKRDPEIGLPALWHQLDRSYTLDWKQELQRDVRRHVRPDEP